jgi:hypothetical protein
MACEVPLQASISRDEEDIMRVMLPMAWAAVKASFSLGIAKEMDQRVRWFRMKGMCSAACGDHDADVGRRALSSSLAGSGSEADDGGGAPA